MIITIDGPAASGKTTTALLLAQQLGYHYINSGLLFRGLAYLLKQYVAEKQASGSLEDELNTHPDLFHVDFTEELLAQHNFRYSLTKNAILINNDENITPLLKSPELDRAASIVSTHPAVRQVFLDYQRKLANDYNVIADGRDCGTIVFPHADYKFFLTANLEERAFRLQQAHNARSIPLDPEYSHYTIEDWKKFLSERDERDSKRALAPLTPAPDAYIIDSSHMTVQEVITEITAVITKVKAPMP